MEQWRDTGYFEWLDNFGGKFEDRHFGFEDGGRFEHCSYFVGEGLSIVRILVLREMEDLKVSILWMLWCLIGCGGVTGIGDS